MNSSNNGLSVHQEPIGRKNPFPFPGSLILPNEVSKEEEVVPVITFGFVLSGCRRLR